MTGWPGTPAAEDFELLVIHTDMERVGEFTCSNGLLNRIYANVVRGIRMQERGLPLDPDRDERQAWLGHEAKTSESEGYVFNVAPFYANFMGEIRIDQRADGNVSDAGSIWPFYSGCAIWPSVVTILPDWYYQLLRRPEDSGAELRHHETVVTVPREEPAAARRHRRQEAAYGDWVDAYSISGRGGENGCHASRHDADRLLLPQLPHAGPHRRNSSAAPRTRSTSAVWGQRWPPPSTRSTSGPKTNAYLQRDPVLVRSAAGFDLVPAGRRAAVAANLADNILVKHRGAPLGRAGGHAVVRADARERLAGRTSRLP